jgi:hypothetical protein
MPDEKPVVKQKTDSTERVVAQATGPPGHADVVFVHAKAEELKFLAKGERLGETSSPQNPLISVYRPRNCLFQPWNQQYETVTNSRRPTQESLILSPWPRCILI